MPTIPVLSSQQAQQLSALLRAKQSAGSASHELPGADADRGLTYVCYIGDAPLLGRTDDTLAKLDLQLYEFDGDELVAVEDSQGNPVTVEVYNLSVVASPTNAYIPVQQEIATGRFVYSSPRDTEGNTFLYPPGIRCNDSNCPAGENIGSTVCCEDTHRVWRAYIPPFGLILFTHVSGDVWESDEIQYGSCPQVYKFRRTLYLDATGRRQSRICLIKVSEDGTTTTSGSTTSGSTTSGSTTSADDCDEIALTYESPWFVNCPCEQPHKLAHWRNHPCCSQVSPLLSQWICLQPVVALGTPGTCEPGAPGLQLPGRYLIDLGTTWEFGAEPDPDFRDCTWLRGRHIVDNTVNATQPCQWKKAVDGVTRLVFWLAVNPGGVPHDELWVTAYPPFNSWRWVKEIPHASFDPEATYALELEFEPSTEYCAGVPTTITVRPYSGQPAENGGACSDPCSDAPTTDTSTTDSSTTDSSTTGSSTTGSSTTGSSTTPASSTYGGTTTVPDGLYCDCKWIWNGSSWDLDNSSCVDCAFAPAFSHCCTPPGSPGGFVGDVEFTFCSTCP